MQNNKNASLSLIAEYGGSESDSDDLANRSSNRSSEDLDNPILSEMVLKNNIINACAHGPLARPVIEENPSHIIIDNTGNGVLQYQVTEYRDLEIESSSSDDSDVDSVKDIEEVLSGDDDVAPGKIEQARVPGEMGLDELPPIQDLAISLPPQETITKIGTVTSVVDKLVVVKGFPDSQAVDLDSVLFLDNGTKVLGRVFDVFGPVKEPHYAVRFNSREHVEQRGVAVGQDVFIAPNTEHTTYVFLHQLMNVKGSDASWLNDIEPPPGHIEYSDDEEERKAKKERNQKKDPASVEDTTKRPVRKARSRPNRQENLMTNFRHTEVGNVNEMRNQYPRFGPPWQVLYENPNLPRPAVPFQPIFGPRAPPPMMNAFQFGSNAYMRGPMHPRSAPMNSWPVFGSNFNNGPWPRSHWPNSEMPPPGT